MVKMSGFVWGNGGIEIMGGGALTVFGAMKASKEVIIAIG